MLTAHEAPEVEVLEVCVAPELAVVTPLDEELEPVEGLELLEDELDPVELEPEEFVEELDPEEPEAPGMVSWSPG